MQTLLQKLALPAADGSPVYQGRSRDEQGRWCSPLLQGTLEELAHKLETPEVCLLLCGTRVVSTTLQVTAAERKHLASLAPFELETNLAAAPESVHVALGPQQGEEVVLACTDKAALVAELASLEALGLDVRHCVAAPLLLPRAEPGWTLALSDALLQVHYGAGKGFSIEWILAPQAVAALVAAELLPGQMEIRAENSADLQLLTTLLQQVLSVNAPAHPRVPEITARIVARWEEMQDPQLCPVSLRQGELAPRLPWQRWWQQSRGLVLTTVAALVVYTGLLFAQTQILDRQFSQLQADITADYRRVMPEGMLVDAEQQLFTQLQGFTGSTNGGGVLPLLAAIAPILAAQPDLTINRLNYHGASQELQLALSAGSNGDILAVAAGLQEQGLQAQPVNFSRQGQQQLANLVIRESAP